MRLRSFLATVSIVAAALCAVRLEAQSPQGTAPYSVVSAGGRRTIATAMAGDREMLRLDELAALLQVTVREDRAAKALTVSRGTSLVVLSLDQGLASMGGKIFSLSAPPARDGSRWLVPPDAVSRALAPIAGVLGATSQRQRAVAHNARALRLRVPTGSAHDAASSAVADRTPPSAPP